jgi:hypothetical protein
MAEAIAAVRGSGWFEACEAVLEADPGRLHVIPGAELSARLVRLLSELGGLGAETGQLDGLRGMAERWRTAAPSPAQWYVDYRWLADQERQATHGSRLARPAAALKTG